MIPDRYIDPAGVCKTKVVYPFDACIREQLKDEKYRITRNLVWELAIARLYNDIKVLVDQASNPIENSTKFSLLNYK